MRRLSHRRATTFTGLAVASGVCIALLVVRAIRTDANIWLAWNLALAWVPFVLAVALYDSHRLERARPLQLLLGALWLLFLPNAPYIVTDFVHVGKHGSSVWYDTGMILAFAATGIVLGLGSIILVQAVVADAVGPRLGWAMVGAVLLLCSVGVYIGRVHRLNSWDALTEPRRLLHLVANQLSDPLGPSSVLLLGLTGCLAVAYCALYTLSNFGSRRRR